MRTRIRRNRELYLAGELVRQHDEELELELEGNAKCVMCRCRCAGMNSKNGN